MNNPTDSALAYVLSQTQENIRFLRSAQQLSEEDATHILAKLSSVPALRNGQTTAPSPQQDDRETSNFSMPLPGLSNLSISNNPTPKPSSLARPPPPIPVSSLFSARATWGYNEDGREAEDLQFSAGDVIEIIDDKNAEWWKGRLRGKQGFFPASYVEVLGPAPSHPDKSAANPSYPVNSYAPNYQYPQQPQQNMYHATGPPQGGQYPVYNQAPPPPPHAPTAVANEEEPKKKPGFFQGKLGNTLAHSAVGGVGFGAGSAVGGGIINAIF